MNNLLEYFFCKILMNKIILSIFINSKRKKFIVPNVLKKIYLFVFNHNPLTSQCNIHYPLTSEAEINLYTPNRKTHSMRSCPH